MSKLLSIIAKDLGKPATARALEVLFLGGLVLLLLSLFKNITSPEVITITSTSIFMGISKYLRDNFK